jgi:hypothetical protein
LAIGCVDGVVLECGVKTPDIRRRRVSTGGVTVRVQRTRVSQTVTANSTLDVSAPAVAGKGLDGQAFRQARHRISLDIDLRTMRLAPGSGHWACGTG